MADVSRKVTVYSADINLFDDEALYDSAYAFVTPERLGKADRMHRESDRKLSILSELLLSCALQSSGMNVHPSFTYGENGKPYLKGGEFNFNISHSATRAICAVTENVYEIGCDIEAYTKCDTRVAERVFEKKEQERLASFSGEDADVLFTRLWTHKESYLKCRGVGITQLGAGMLSGYSFFEYSGFLGYSCSICLSSEEEFVPEFVEVTPEMLRLIFSC